MFKSEELNPGTEEKNNGFKTDTKFTSDKK